MSRTDYYLQNCASLLQFAHSLPGCNITGVQRLLESLQRSGTAVLGNLVLTDDLILLCNAFLQVLRPSNPSCPELFTHHG